MAFPLPLRRYGPSPFPAQKRSLGVGPGLRPGVNELAHLHRCQPLIGAGGLHLVVGPSGSSSDHYAARIVAELALPLFVTRIGTDHHNPPVPTDQPALVTDRLDARVYLHDCLGPVLWVCRYLYRYTMRPRDRS